MSKAVLNEPKGQRLFEMYTALSHINVASYTSSVLPCLPIKQTTVKVTSKGQQTLVSNNMTQFTSFHPVTTPVGRNFLTIYRHFIELATCIKAH